MITTNLFVTANVKQLRTGGSFRILLSFFPPNILGVFGFLNWAILNSFHSRVEFGTILEGLWHFGGVWTPQIPLGTPLCGATVLFGLRRWPKRRCVESTYTYLAKKLCTL